MTDQTYCKHCKTPNTSHSISSTINDKTFYFCCNGCKNAFDILQKEGLNSFYTKLGNSKISNISTYDNDLEKYNTLAFREEFITIDKDNHFQSHFLIEGITCSACVWLNESILLKQEGIISANVNMTNNSAKIVWDNSLIQVSNIIQIINSIGYQAHPYTPKLANEQLTKEKKDYISKLFVALFGSLNIMMVDISKYRGLFTFIEQDVKSVFHIAEFAIASLVLIYSGSVFFKKAYGGIKNYIINMEFLVIFGAVLGYGYSLWVLGSGYGETYFDSVVMIITFVLIGKYLELISKQKSIQALQHIQDIPMMINVVDAKGNITPTLSRLVQKNDSIAILPHERVIVDGEITKNKGHFDISAINGESKPSYKKIGDKITSGSVSIDASIVYRATSNYSNSFLGKISVLLQNSFNTKTSSMDKISAISSYFGGAIILVSIATFIGWYIATGVFSQAFIIGISVVIISCPCALAISIPISIMVSLNSLVQKNIICKDSSLLETITKSKYCVFDKTNTLTNGNFIVSKYKLKNLFDINLLYSILQTTSHPVSKAIYLFIQKEFQDLREYEIASIKHISSKGIQAHIDNKHILIGNKKLLKQNNISVPIIKTNSSLLLVACDGEFVGHFELDDELQEGALETIKDIKKRGLIPLILSGDNKKATKKIANILEVKYKSNYSPKKKKAYIKKLQTNSKVIMIGDGVNDSLALLQSDISISFYDASNIAIESSDILLGNKNINNISSLLDISSKSQSLIKQNISLSIGYNILTIPLAIMGHITPLIAALSMSASSLIVVVNALRVQWSSDRR